MTVTADPLAAFTNVLNQARLKCVGDELTICRKIEPCKQTVKNLRCAFALEIFKPKLPKIASQLANSAPGAHLRVPQLRITTDSGRCPASRPVLCRRTKRADYAPWITNKVDKTSVRNNF